MISFKLQEFPAHKTKAGKFVFFVPILAGKGDSNLFSDMLHGSNSD